MRASAVLMSMLAARQAGHSQKPGGTWSKGVVRQVSVVVKAGLCGWSKQVSVVVKAGLCGWSKQVSVVVTAVSVAGLQVLW